MLTENGTQLLRNGQDHRIISGALHYFRVHPDLWRDRLLRLKAMGCNTVETYVAWNWHAPSPEQVDFTSCGRDLGAFLDLAADLDLDIIVRPGPYICAEWECGGLPGWVLRDRNSRLRTTDAAYLEAVDGWFDALIPIIVARQASNGGRVVMVQVENEYGSYGDDKEYLEHLRDGLLARGVDQLLVTSDGDGQIWLEPGTVEGAWPTMNFGNRPEQAAQVAAKAYPGRPLMVMEYWNGWFDHWGEPHHTRSAEDAAQVLAKLLELGFHVNFYMAHGGTNFGLFNGANYHDELLPTVTSYDYDAAISEDGAITDKFVAFRKVISQFTGTEPAWPAELEERPARLAARDLPIAKVSALAESDLWNADPIRVAGRTVRFEELGIERGMIKISRTVQVFNESRTGVVPPLRFYGLGHRAYVFIDGVGRGVVANPPAKDSCAEFALEGLVEDGQEVRIELLIENQGRVNFGPRLGEGAGVDGVWLGNRFLNGWQVTRLPLEELARQLGALPAADAPSLPVVLHSSFEIDQSESDPVPATYLDTSKLGRGVAFINGFCLGRYWNIGPQQALYVPGPVLRPGRNEVVVLELEQSDGWELSLSDEPKLG